MDTNEKSFDKFDEHDLSLVLQQVRRRLIMIRQDTPDAPFWFSTLVRVGKWLDNSPVLNPQEKNTILNPPDGLTSGRVRAIRMFRERTGMRLRACQDVVNKWMTDNNIPIVLSGSGGVINAPV